MAQGESSEMLADMLRASTTVPSAQDRVVRTRPEDFMRGKGKGKKGKPVTMDVREATQRLAFGKRAPSGGQQPTQHPERPQPPVDTSAINTQKAAGRTPSYDPFGDADDPETGAEARIQDTAPVQEAPEPEPEPDAYGAPIPERPRRPTQPYTHPEVKRIRLVMGLSEGDMHVTVQDVILSGYGVVVLIPNDNNSMFLPKPGTEIRLSWDDKVIPAYYPGVTFELNMLQCTGLVFIRKLEDDAVECTTVPQT